MDNTPDWKFPIHRFHVFLRLSRSPMSYHSAIGSQVWSVEARVQQLFVWWWGVRLRSLDWGWRVFKVAFHRISNGDHSAWSCILNATAFFIIKDTTFHITICVFYGTVYYFWNNIEISQFPNWRDLQDCCKNSTEKPTNFLTILNTAVKPLMKVFAYSSIDH